ncbi:hypothetical protein D3C71_1233920 [compost metagenome]
MIWPLRCIISRKSKGKGVSATSAPRSVSTRRASASADSASASTAMGCCDGGISAMRTPRKGCAPAAGSRYRKAGRPCVSGSCASGPAMRAVSSIASRVSRVSGPMESSVVDSATAPCRLISPRVVFSPVTPFSAAGIRTEPPVSEPSAAGARPAATATPDPLDEPPGMRACRRSQGLRGVPMTGLVPHPPNANSTMWVLPSITMPASSKRVAAVAVTVLRRSRQASEPAVVTWPWMSQRSLTATGTPSSGLSRP